MSEMDIFDADTVAHLTANATPCEQEKIVALLNHARELKKSGRSLPGRHTRRGEIIVHASKLTEDAGLKPRSLNWPGVAAIMPVLIDAIGIEANTPVTRALARIRAWGKRLLADGETVPGYASGRIAIKAAEKAAGVPASVRLNPQVRLAFLEVAAVCGVGFRHGARRDSLTEAVLLKWEKEDVSGRGVPESSRLRGEPNVFLIARETGLTENALKPGSPGRMMLAGIIERNGLFEPVKSPRVWAKTEQTLLAYAARCVAEGRGLPALDKEPGRRHLPHIARETGLWSGTLRTPLATAILDQIEARIGLTLLLKPVSDPELTLAGMLVAVEQELEQSPGMPRKKNVGTAIRRVIEAAGEDAPAKQAIENALSTMPGDDRDRSDLEFAQATIARLEATDLPADFGAALNVARRRAGYSWPGLEKRFGHRIRNWVQETPGPAFYPMIAEMERHLGLEPDTLRSRMTHKRGTDSRLSSILPELKHRPQHVSRWVTQQLTEEDRRGSVAAMSAKAAVLLAKYDARRSRTARMLQQTSRRIYAFKEWPEALERRFAEMLRAKTDNTAPGDRLKPVAPFWTRGTPAKNRTVFECFFGWLLLDEPGRPAIPVENLSFGYLLCPEVIEAYIMFRRRRCQLPDEIKLPPPGVILRDFAYICRSFVFDTQALLRQQPDLADELKPIPGLISPADIAKIRPDWDRACDQAADHYRIIVKRIRAQRKNEDTKPASFDKVMTIVSDPDPIRYMVTMIERQRQYRRTLSPGSPAWAIAVRDEAYLCLQAQCCFRGDTLCEIRLDHVKDNGEVIMLEIARKYFKNENSPVFRRGTKGIDYRERLRDVNGTYATLRLYRDVARLTLGAGNRMSFFVNRSGERAGQTFFSRLCHSLVTRLLCFNAETGTGDPELVSFPNHCIRHILATATWLRTRSWAAVAYVLRDTEAVVKQTYAFIWEIEWLGGGPEPLDLLFDR